MLRWLRRRVEIARHLLAVRQGHRRVANERQRWFDRAAASGAFVDPSVTLRGEAAGEAITFGEQAVVEHGVTFWISPEHPASAIRIGARSFVGHHSYIAAHDPITIGDDVLIASFSYVGSSNHQTARLDVPIREQGMVGEPIVIEDDVWVGTHVSVLPGAILRRGCVIAANAAVNCEVPEYEVWGGVPARFIKRRG
jgi:acetyltransferase-like isoleucine patch superfamily enzyme